MWSPVSYQGAPNSRSFPAQCSPACECLSDGLPLFFLAGLADSLGPLSSLIGLSTAMLKPQVEAWGPAEQVRRIAWAPFVLQQRGLCFLQAREMAGQGTSRAASAGLEEPRLHALSISSHRLPSRSVAQDCGCALAEAGLSGAGCLTLRSLSKLLLSLCSCCWAERLLARTPGQTSASPCERHICGFWVMFSR